MRKTCIVVLFSACFLILILISACLNFQRKDPTPTISIEHKLLCSKGLVRKIVVLPFVVPPYVPEYYEYFPAFITQYRLKMETDLDVMDIRNAEHFLCDLKKIPLKDVLLQLEIPEIARILGVDCVVTGEILKLVPGQLNKSRIQLMFYAVYKDGDILWQARGIAEGCPREVPSTSPIQNIMRQTADYLTGRPGGKTPLLAKPSEGTECLMESLLTEIVHKFISAEVKVGVQ